MMNKDIGGYSDLRSKLDDIIEGPIFTAIIQFLILASAVAIVLETESFFDDYKFYFDILDWTFLILFTVEYVLRIYTAPDRSAFIFSFFGIVDLLSILPALVLIPGLGSVPGFRVLRVLRFLRVFRIFKATRFILAVDRMIDALGEVKREIFALVILSSMLVYLAACGIYYFEKDVQSDKFGSILDSMWWAIVTLTTIGYGDVFPVTAGGKVFTALVALVGVGLIAIPSGLLASVLTQARVEEDILEEQQEGERSENDENQNT